MTPPVACCCLQSTTLSFHLQLHAPLLEHPSLTLQFCAQYQQSLPTIPTSLYTISPHLRQLHAHCLAVPALHPHLLACRPGVFFFKQSHLFLAVYFTSCQFCPQFHTISTASIPHNSTQSHLICGSSMHIAWQPQPSSHTPAGLQARRPSCHQPPRP